MIFCLVHFSLVFNFPMIQILINVSVWHTHRSNLLCALKIGLHFEQTHFLFFKENFSFYLCFFTTWCCPRNSTILQTHMPSLCRVYFFEMTTMFFKNLFPLLLRKKWESNIKCRGIDPWCQEGETQACYCWILFCSCKLATSFSS